MGIMMWTSSFVVLGLLVNFIHMAHYLIKTKSLEGKSGTESGNSGTDYTWGGKTKGYETKGVCDQPHAKNGECYGYSKRWTFNKATRTCRTFGYGGCGGNENMFGSKAECEKTCGVTVGKGHGKKRTEKNYGYEYKTTKGYGKDDRNGYKTTKGYGKDDRYGYKTTKGYGKDDGPGYKCKLKKRGEMKQHAIVGCGGGIKMECTGGCLKIHQTLYNREENPDEMGYQSFPYQRKMVESLCNNKEKCTVQASREMFGYNECPEYPDSDMALFITYSCDGGQDGTRLTGPKRCKKRKGKTTTEKGDGYYGHTETTKGYGSRYGGTTTEKDGGYYGYTETTKGYGSRYGKKKTDDGYDSGYGKKKS